MERWGVKIDRALLTTFTNYPSVLWYFLGLFGLSSLWIECTVLITGIPNWYILDFTSPLSRQCLYGATVSTSVSWSDERGSRRGRSTELLCVFTSGTAISLTVLDTVFTPDNLHFTKCHIWQIWHTQYTCDKKCDTHNVTHTMWHTHTDGEATQLKQIGRWHRWHR